MAPMPMDAAAWNRRELVFGVAASAMALSLAGATTVGAAPAPVPLPALVYGDGSAPITVIEYTSLTCSHCARFHVETLPDFKRTHIDTGRARLVLREFPLDPRSLAGFMLARCLGGEQTYSMIDLLFQQQSNWARAKDGAAALEAMARVAGMSRDQFVTCLADSYLQAAIEAVSDTGAKQFGITATPTFIVNDEVHVGALSVSELAKIVG